MVQPIAERKHLLVQATVDSAVPTYIEVDEVRLRQILINLLNNAVKYTDSGAVKISVTCSSSDGISFSVQDTGIGLPDAADNCLFSPFTRGSNACSRPGTGLGLTIAHTLIERLGGQLRAESPADGGSTFSFSLNLKSSAIPPPALQLQSPNAILIVDDEPLNRRVAVHLAGRIHPSAAIHTAADGAETVGIWQQHSVDVILMDVHMPGMNGYQAVKAIRKLEPAHRQPTIVIALTGESSPASCQACREAGFDTVLTKPLSARTLTAVLQQQLSARSRRNG